MYDVLIIGAGVCGCAAARELSRRKRTIAVLDAAADVGEGTSKANSGIVHAGHDAKPGTLKARLNLRGSEMMASLSRELAVPYRQNGAMVVCFDKKDKKALQDLYDRGIANGVPKLQILTKKEILEKEPHIGPDVVAALYAPTSALVCPFGLTIAMAENAVVNGVSFFLSTRVTAIDKIAGGYRITAGGRTFESKIVINAAGVHGDDIHNMISNHKLALTPRKGEYLLFDKKQGSLISHTLFQLPTALGKGVLLTPTVHGNLLAGPTAEDIMDKEGTDTTRQGLETIINKAGLSVSGLPARDVITSFAGLRAHYAGGDFIIGAPADAPGFIEVAGIDSPGLSSAPAIGEYVAQLVQEILPAEENEDFIAKRKGIPSMQEATPAERKQLIQENPAYANVICRCEMVTEGEVLAAIHRPLGAKTTDGIKRRVRAGFGRCQAGFCAPHMIEILAREWQCDKADITKCGGDSYYLDQEEQS